MLFFSSFKTNQTKSKIDKTEYFIYKQPMSIPVMIPLEMHGMVHYSHPMTPYVGLYRQSGDPEITKQSYKKARQKRDTVCFPFMLRQMTNRSLKYRSIRRLWITTLNKILNGRLYKHFLVKTILDYLSIPEQEQIPLFYCKHLEESLHYESLNLQVRMEQFAGRLVSLGYNTISILTPDYEYESYLVLCKELEKNTITLLYHELKKKGIPNVKRIMLSHIREPKLNGIEWIHYCRVNRLSLYLNSCIRANHLCEEEILLLKSWCHYMKYPSI
jgi:hypothetical protein